MANVSVKNLRTAKAVLGAAAPKYASSKATQKAYQALKNSASDNGKWAKQINANLDTLNQMGDFDANKSAYYQSSYQAMKNAYRDRAKADMQNTAAAAAGNTEGFGNSYAASAANKAYQSRWNELSAKLPTLYSDAAQEFANRKEALTSLIGLQQAGQQSAVDSAKMMLDAQQALDEQRYAAAQYEDSVKRNNALRYLQQYYNKVIQEAAT